MAFIFTGNFRSVGALQWAPTLTAHDPNPPINLRNPLVTDSTGFPVVQSKTTSSLDNPTGTALPLVVSMPATVNSGDLLLMIECNTGDLTGGTVTPSGWTMIWNGDDSDNSRAHIFAKAATGSEGGTTVNIAYAEGTVWAAAIVYRITMWKNSGTLANDINALETFVGSFISNPPLLTTTWGKDKNLWLAVSTGKGVQELNAEFLPEDYVNGVDVDFGAFNGITSGERLYESASEDPTAFKTMITFGRNWAITIAIRPGIAAVVAPRAFVEYRRRRVA